MHLDRPAAGKEPGLALHHAVKVSKIGSILEKPDTSRALSPGNNAMGINPVSSRLKERFARLRNLGPMAPAFRWGIRTRRLRPGEFSIALPFKRSGLAITITGVVLALFCVPYFSVGGMVGGTGGDSLFDLVFVLFGLFWLTGWSVGTTFLLLVFLILALGRESLHVRPGYVALRIEVLGLGLGLEFKTRGIENLRFAAADEDEGSAWRGQHLAFDYVGEPVAFGSGIDAGRAAAMIQEIKAVGWAPSEELNADLASSTPQSGPARQTVNTAAPDRETSTHPAGGASVQSPSTLALVIANLIPLLGVLLYDWNIGEIMLLFWAESAIVGFFNLLKMWWVGRWAVLFMGPFFVGHFGGFMVGHLLFIYALFLSGADTDVSTAQVMADFVRLWPALLGLFLSHAYSYHVNFVGRREYVGRDMSKQMTEPYARIIVMHVTLIMGAFLVTLFNSRLAALALLILLKIGVDIRSHVRQHSGPG